MMKEYGYIEIRLDRLLEERNWSKNKFSCKVEMNGKQIDRLPLFHPKDKKK